MMVVIERCEKRPGIFTGARAYRLVLNEQGLYVIELGKAMGYRNKSNVIADKLLDSMEKKRLEEQAQRTAELENIDLAQVVKNKKNFFLEKGSGTQVQFQQGAISRIFIKSPRIKMTLFLSPFDTDKAAMIQAFFSRV